MLITFGKYKGSTTALVTLKSPEYVTWALGAAAPGGTPLGRITQAFRAHVRVFDAKPFITHCLQCGQPATRAAYFHGSLVPSWWCSTCAPPKDGRTTLVSTYLQATAHVQETCKGRLADYEAIIRELALAKGAPQRMGEQHALLFLNEPTQSEAPDS